MRSPLYSYIFTLSCLTALLAGCGSGGGTPVVKNTLHESTACIGCHEDPKWTTPGTGKPAVAEWKLSTHMIANGAGCADCHDDGYMHPASCSKCHSVGSLAQNPTTNPDRDNKCAKCHAKVNPRPGHFDGYSTTVPVPGMSTTTNTRFVHFSTGLRANYVSSSNKLHCRNCHNPHNTTFGREQRKAWTESGHGNSRGLARVTLDAKTRGTSIPLDQNINNRNYCVRCHTSTGFINFVADDAFTNINALPDIGADGLPDPNGFRSNYPEYTFKTGDQRPYAKNPDGTAGAVRPYADTSREATNCNVCHLDTRSNDSGKNPGPSSYSGTLRPVARTTGVRIYYPYSSSGTGHFQAVTPVQFDTLGSSNLCLTCHSGRATGRTIREPGMFASISSNKRPSSPSVHDFAGGAVLQAEKTAFFFYTSPAKYKTFPAHRTLNASGNGPCITCHMPMVPSNQSAGGAIHSHLYRPVTWTNDDLNAPIIDPIISNPTVCSLCHKGTAGTLTAPITPASMNALRNGFRVSVLILNKLLPSSSNWTGRNTNGGLNITYGNSIVPALGGARAGVFTMGANYNYGFLFNEPSSYNHSPILARQLIYDSIDWLKNGAAGFGSATSPSTVYAAIKGVPLFTSPTPPALPAPNLNWSKADPIQGAILAPVIPNKIYNTFSTEADRETAFFFICKDYVSGSNLCNRW